MSVRRLADTSVQPPSFAFTDALVGEAQDWIGKFPEGRQQSAVIPLLMLAQDQEGWVTRAAIEKIADMLRMPYIRALEVATFYTQFQLKPPGTRAHVQVCGTTPCMLRGSEALMDVCREKIHHDQFHPNVSGTLSWEEVECLGACVNAPMVMIFKDTYEDLTPARLGEIIDAFERGEGAEVPVGPQNGREGSVPATGRNTLLDEQVFIDAAQKRKQAEEVAERDGGSVIGTDGASPSPSKAAKPATDAIETNAAVAGPSPEKKSKAEEGAGESEAPPFDAKAADKAEPAVEGGDKGRARPIRADEQAPYKAPELQLKPMAGESGKSVEAVAPAAGGSSGLEASSDAGSAAAGGETPARSIAKVGASEALAESSVPLKRGDAAGDLPPASNGEAGPVIEVSGSNTPVPGDAKLVSEPEGAGAGRLASGDGDRPFTAGAGQAARLAQAPADDNRPASIERPERPDDLKMISGVGPKIEGILHSLGIFTFAQIAVWRENERRWVDHYLRFSGRIERDDWVRQAKALAEGGEQEYIRVFGKKPR